MAAPGERYLAADVHGMGAGASDKNIPEWKKQTVGINMAHGRVTNKTIKEQRESLPIYKLRYVPMEIVNMCIFLHGVLLSIFNLLRKTF